MFSLHKLPYYFCDEEERTFYDDLETIEIDIQHCCIDLLRFLKIETKSNIMNDNIDLNYDEYSMIEKVTGSSMKVTGSHGREPYACWRLPIDSSSALSTHTTGAVHGTSRYVSTPRPTATWSALGTPEKRVVHGTCTRVKKRPEVGNLCVWRTLKRTAAFLTCPRVTRQRQTGTANVWKTVASRTDAFHGNIISMYYHDNQKFIVYPG
ncbi:unnamed protein product [Macrosiphum euphorbiae]|uniref:Uncharacterized protein n=1 Tax=Macrosiphum euphorbiae TaxID=13131 RepID=A0AAV0YA95_9HEMI|nr:unnamed protein product [Macrosiphum euphorbiae]